MTAKHNYMQDDEQKDNLEEEVHELLVIHTS